MLLEIGLILVLIIINGLFSMSEIAIVSARKSRLEGAAQKGDRSARLALELANHPNRFLSTVQVGITLIGVLTGVFGGDALASRLAGPLATLPYVGPYSNALALALVVLAITFFSLVIGELVPKRLGMHNPERIARIMAGPMLLVSRVCAPLVWLLSTATDLLLRLFRLKPSAEPPVTEEEIKSLIAQGTTTGMFEEVEQDIVERVFALSDRKVGSIMTHKIDVEWLDINDGYEDNREKVLTTPHTSYPVCEDSIDEVIGILHTNSFLVASMRQDQVDLRALLEKPLFIPENMKAFRVLEKFRESKIRMAVVVDEFGTVQGLVTMKDIFEAMVGELEQVPEEEAGIVEREDGTFLVDALLPFEEFVQYFEIDDADSEERAGFHTLGGLIIHIARQIPKTGEKFHWKHMDLEIIDMDGNRIDKVLVQLRARGSH